MMFLKKRGQVTLEIIALLAITSIILIVIFVLAFSTIRSSSQMDRDAAATQSLIRLENAVVMVYSQGNGSKTDIAVILPGDVFSSFLTRTTFGFNYSNTDGSQYAKVRSPGVNMSGSLPNKTGTYYVTVTSNGNNVTLSYT
jgi:heme/copper-type cytochrome/quinol oxidase subunit 2